MKYVITSNEIDEWNSILDIAEKRIKCEKLDLNILTQRDNAKMQEKLENMMTRKRRCSITKHQQWNPIERNNDLENCREKLYVSLQIFAQLNFGNMVQTNISSRKKKNKNKKTERVYQQEIHTKVT